jgi:FtsH-binding integral membrane protein
LSFLRPVVDELVSQFRLALEARTRRLLRQMVKLLAMGVAGIALVSTGFVFVLVASAIYLSQVVYLWLAWGIVGLVTLLVGGGLLLFVVYRR